MGWLFNGIGELLTFIVSVIFAILEPVFDIIGVLLCTFIYNGIVLAIVIGILSALFVKYLFDFVFPKPLDGDEGEDM